MTANKFMYWPSPQVATESDAPAIIALWATCQLTRPWNDAAADFALALRAAGSAILIQREPITQTIIATVMVGFDGHRGWVYYLAVAPDQRGRGLGRAMMVAAEDWLRAQGAPKIQLMVRDDNAATIAFYTTLGYARQGVVTLGRRLDSSGEQ